MEMKDTDILKTVHWVSQYPEPEYYFFQVSFGVTVGFALSIQPKFPSVLSS